MKNINNNRPNEEWWKNVNATEWENEVIRRKNEGDSDYVEMEKYILNYFKKFNDVKILDYGCGFGRNSLNLLKNTKNEIFGVDINKSMTEVVSQKIQDKNYTNTHFKVLAKDKTIPFPDNYFDYTFTNEVLIHVHPDDVLDTLKEIFRVTNNKILLLENILVSKSVQSNLAHNGCWLHDFISIIKKNVPYKLTITSGIISRQDIYEIDKTSSSKMITLYSNKGKITDIDKIYRIGDQNLISNLNKENSGNIYWINQKNTLIDTLEKNNEKISKELNQKNILIDTLEKNNEKISKKLHEYKKEAKINKNKITNLDQELINIHNSKLWKLFLIYKSLSKLKINIKHKKELDDSFIKYIPGKFKKNKVLGICHDDWYGVKNATLNQCSDVITIHNFDENTSNKIIAYIKKNKIKKVSINAIIDNMGYFVTLLKKQLPEVKIYFIWHGSFTQQTIEDHISRFNSLYPYFDKIYKFGFVKNGMADIFKKLGINKAEFIPNRINDPVIKNNRKPNNKPRIGILANFLWHKNNVNQIIAALLLPKKEIHTLYTPNFLYLTKLVRNNIIRHPFLPSDDYLKLLSNMDINLYVSLTECYPMTFIESLTYGVPCLVGKTSEYILNNNKKLKKYLVVQNPEDYNEIKEKIEDILKNYKNVNEQCHDFITKLNIDNSKEILHFFENEN